MYVPSESECRRIVPLKERGHQTEYLIKDLFVSILFASTSHLNSISIRAVVQWTPPYMSYEDLTFRMLEPQLVIVLLKTSFFFFFF